jgi:hypothetical protein
MRPDIDVYLNVDGVLLDDDSQPANYSREFLKYAVPNFDTYWLTRRDKDSGFVVLRDLSKTFEPRIMHLISQIRPTRWSFAKTQAINFERPFLWFDDELVIHERLELIKYNALPNWVNVDLSRDENRLADFLVRFPHPADYILF